MLPKFKPSAMAASLCEKDFSAVKTTHGTDLQAPVVIRKKSGRPVSMQS